MTPGKFGSWWLPYGQVVPQVLLVGWWLCMASDGYVGLLSGFAMWGYEVHFSVKGL